MEPATSSELRPVTPVSILAAGLRSLLDDLGSGERWSDRHHAELAALSELASGFDPYLEAMTTPASPDLDDLARRTVEADWGGGGSGPGLEAEMLSGHVEGRFLRFLVAATGARRVLEIGMFTGYSALAMAEALPDDGVVVACELDADVARFAQDRFDRSTHGDRIEVRVGPAIETLTELDDRGESFDLVFVDADKAGYVGYLDAVLDGRLLAPGGIVCVDNTLLQGRPWLDGRRSENGDAIARFNRHVADDGRVEQVVLPVRDGLTLIRRVDD
ncbi:O-methyltransferase [Ilumatobacter sp.]|uniref:O-methyltransferase n=1 Tax=Ilumatobacter sp. TaxID=1967498 RepID=UPI003B519C36